MPKATARASAPTEAPRSRVAQFLAQQMEHSGKTQREIARELGYTRPNVVTMIKQGETKLPLSKVKPMAGALGIDPARLLRMAMEEYMPEALAVIEEVLGTIVTDNEKEILEVIRDATDDTDPKMRPKERERLRQWALKLAE